MLFREISLRPEVSSPPLFRFQGGPLSVTQQQDNISPYFLYRTEALLWPAARQKSTFLEYSLLEKMLQYSLKHVFTFSSLDLLLWVKDCLAESLLKCWNSWENCFTRKIDVTIKMCNLLHCILTFEPDKAVQALIFFIN